jgi:hypothetical protein
VSRFSGLRLLLTTFGCTVVPKLTAMTLIDPCPAPSMSTLARKIREFRIDSDIIARIQRNEFPKYLAFELSFVSIGSQERNCAIR